MLPLKYVVGNVERVAAAFIRAGCCMMGRDDKIMPNGHRRDSINEAVRHRTSLIVRDIGIARRASIDRMSRWDASSDSLVGSLEESLLTRRLGAATAGLSRSAASDVDEAKAAAGARA